VNSAAAQDGNPRYVAKPMSTAKSMFTTMVLALAGMVLVYVGVGYMLADRWHVDTSRAVTAGPDKVAALVKDFRTWENWSSMQANLGAGTKSEITGQPGTAIQRITWTGSLGTATLTMTAVEVDSLAYEFHLRQPDMTEPELRGKGTLRWQADGTGTAVTWHDEALLDTLPLRWFGWFGALQEKVKQIQGTSLAGLQQTFDAAGKTPAAK